MAGNTVYDTVVLGSRRATLGRAPRRGRVDSRGFGRDAHRDPARPRGGFLGTLRSTNPIENLQETTQRIVRNVKRRRGRAMALRWCVTALIEAEKEFRRVKGQREMPQLLIALEAEVNKNVVDRKERVASNMDRNRCPLSTERETSPARCAVAVRASCIIRSSCDSAAAAGTGTRCQPTSSHPERHHRGPFPAGCPGLVSSPMRKSAIA
jgi:hypothetical protein